MSMKVVGLFAVAVLLTALLFQVNPSSEPDEPRFVFPGLKEQLSEVSSIEVVHPDGRKVVLTKDQTVWVLPEKSGYPADFKVISEFLVGLSELVIAEEKTAIAANHGRLGVKESAEEPGNDGVGVIVNIGPGNHSLVIGRAAASRGTFVRYRDDDQVYLTNEVVRVPDSVMGWVDAVVINVDAENVKEVTLVNQSSETLSGARNEETGEFELLNVPEDRELKYGSVGDSLARLLVNVRMTNLAPYEPGLFAEAATARFSLLSGEAITVRTVATDGIYWMHIDRQSLADWQFGITEFTFKAFNKTMEDMLQVKESVSE